MPNLTNLPVLLLLLLEQNRTRESQRHRTLDLNLLLPLRLRVFHELPQGRVSSAMLSVCTTYARRGESTSLRGKLLVRSGLDANVAAIHLYEGHYGHIVLLSTQTQTRSGVRVSGCHVAKAARIFTASSHTVS